MNIKEVAEKAGVSITTVSRVLNSPDMVSEKTKERIMSVMDELNYTPNWFARNLQTNRTNVIGMLVPDTLEQSNMEIAKGVENIARQHKCNIILCSTGFDINVEREHIATLVQRNTDGIILTSSALEPKDISRLKGQKVPFVMVEKNKHLENENMVYTDYDIASEEAVRHLIDMGRKHIAVILSQHPETINKEKLAGYRKALDSGRLKFDESLIMVSENTIEGGFIATSKLLERANPPDAIFIASDTMAFGAIERMKQDDLTPDELAIVGFDDLKTGAVVEPKLTTVTKPSYRMGLTAARLLFDIIEDNSLMDDTQAIILKSRLKIRKSCGNKERLKEIW